MAAANDAYYVSDTLTVMDDDIAKGIVPSDDAKDVSQGR